MCVCVGMCACVCVYVRACMYSSDELKVCAGKKIKKSMRASE